MDRKVVESYNGIAILTTLLMQSRVRLFSPDRFLYSAALHCGLIRLAIWSRLKATPLTIRSDLEV